jgi:hypothetical protein
VQPPSQRVSPVVFPKSWELPARPDGADPAALDAHRQTEFQLKGDLRLLHQGMNLILRVVADTYPSKYRTHAAAVMEMYWSRAFHYLSGSAALISRGAYVGVAPLLRSACECHSAAVQLGGEELGEFLGFLAASLRPNEEFRATDIGRGSYHAGGTLASDALLGLIYRSSTELARPHFGATLIAVAPESNLQKLGVLFGDQAFHFGWAQLTLGWLIGLCSVVLRHATGGTDVLGVTDDTRTEVDAYLTRADAVLAAPGRCRIEEVEQDFERRFLVSNFRRQSGGAPRKLLL